MTEEERMREVERISRRTKESVKIPPDQQRTIRIVRFRNKTLASYVGTMEEALRKAKEMEGLYRTDRTHRIKKTHVFALHESG